MSNAKTVGELLDRLGAASVEEHAAVVKDYPHADVLTEGFEMGAAYARERFKPVLGALIGAQGRVVYTAEDVERAAAPFCALCPGCEPHARLGVTGCKEALAIARLAITAAGGVVADEVVEARCGHALGYDDIHCVSPVVRVHDGDKLYIARAKGE